MEEELPRHERILKRMSGLTRKAINSIQLNCEGGMTLTGDKQSMVISGRSSSPGKNVFIPADYLYQTAPLYKIGDGEFVVTVGTVNGIVLTLGGMGIYGDGSPNSIPVFTDDNCEVWARMTIAPTDVFMNAPLDFRPGNMRVSAGSVVTTGLSVVPSETLGAVVIATGATTAGTYYYWMCRVVDGELITSPSIGSRNFFQSGLGTGANWGALTFGMQEIIVGDTVPEIDYL